MRDRACSARSPRAPRSRARTRPSSRARSRGGRSRRRRCARRPRSTCRSTAATPAPSCVPQRSAPIPSLTISGARFRPRLRRQLLSEEGEVLGPVGAGEAEPGGGEVGRCRACGRECLLAARTISTSAGSGSELWMSAVPASPRRGRGRRASVTTACVFVLPPSTPRRSVPAPIQTACSRSGR